MLDLLTR